MPQVTISSSSKLATPESDTGALRVHVEGWLPAGRASSLLDLLDVLCPHIVRTSEGASTVAWWCEASVGAALDGLAVAADYAASLRPVSLEPGVV